MIEEIIEQYYDEEILKADGFDDAVIGIEENDMRLIYSVSKCLKILELEMSDIDALEYFTFNVSGAYVGEKLRFGVGIILPNTKIKAVF